MATGRQPRAYVYKIATNLARKAWRTRARDVQTLVAVSRHWVTDVPGPDPSVVVVRSAVAGLPRRLGEVVLLHYFADLSVTDIATAIGRPAGTVKRQLSEARALLADALEVADE